MNDIAFSVIINNDGISDIIFKTIMLKGEKGNSVARVEKTSTSGLVDTYTIFLTDGTIGGTFTVTNGILGTFDDELDSTSENAVQNKVVKASIDALDSRISPLVLLSNLWNYGTTIDNRSVKNNGDLLTNSDYKTTDYIPVKEGDIVYGYGSRFACYDSNKTFISSTSDVLNNSSLLSNGMHYYVIPPNASYIRICANKTIATPNQFQLWLADSFENNLKSSMNSLCLLSNLWEFGGVLDNSALSASNGKILDNNDFKTTDYIPVNEGDIVYGYGARFCCYDSNKTFISSASAVLNNLSTELSNGMHYYVIPPDVSYFRICANKTIATPNQFQLSLVNPFEMWLYNIKASNMSSKMTMYCLGDSITKGMYTNEGSSSSVGKTEYGYPYWIGFLNNFNVVNLGVSGSGYVKLGTPEAGVVEDDSQPANACVVVDDNTFTGADIITLAFGVNDWKGDSNIYLGSIQTSASRDGTVIGNMMYCIETLATKAPYANIIVLLPMNQNRFGNTVEADNYSFGYSFHPEQDNKTLTDYRNAIKDCADYYNLKVVDPEEICAINRKNLRNVLGDGLHPTLAFYRQMGHALAPFIR